MNMRNKWNIILILVLLYLLYEVIVNTKNNFKIKDKGVSIKAIVVDSYKVGGKGKVNTCYEFYISNVKFESCRVADKLYNIGDSIEIIYIPDSPQNNNIKDLIY